ncbi:MAG: Ig-like domain-containing protein [Bacteroidales bacterium]|jgi:hypothetical protein|nr:Ig-like domain-containing protein [Bacteroidales bacterium]
MRRKTIKFIFAMALLLLGIYSCANMANPTGGPKDEDPPKFVRSNPNPNSLKFNKKKIEIYFDENIQLDKISEKLVISPPQKKMPTVKFLGKRLHIELMDTLQPNTTYTIDFGDAIVDNNERNPLQNFVFSFSTGDVIDSLEVSGILLNAANLEPVSGKIVGLHKNLHDTAFTTEPFYRIGNTDAAGHFSIKNLSEGSYRIFALGDLNRNYKYDPGEEIAFYDSLIVPRFEPRLRNDTVWRDSITVDTVITREYTHYLPDDILLHFFKENVVKNQFLQKYERSVANKFTFFFNAPSKELPEIVPLNFPDSDDWCVLEKNPTNDTLHYWITNPAVFKKDTLRLQINYLKTDSLKQLSLFTDTLTVVWKKTKLNEKKKKKEIENENDSIEIQYFNSTIQLASTLDINRSLAVEWETPVKTYNPDGIHLEIRQDTLWKTLKNYSFEQDESQNLRTFRLLTKWTPGGEYRFSIDSAAFFSIYDTHNKAWSSTFKVKKLEEYSVLYFNITNLNSPAFVELLDKSDKPVRKAPVKNFSAEFPFLPPGTYYARIVLDENDNGIWDAGNYSNQIQPETVYYFYKGGIKLMANFEDEQEWDLTAVPTVRQKPQDVLQNKPKEKTSSASNAGTRNTQGTRGNSSTSAPRNPSPTTPPRGIHQMPGNLER